MQSILISKRAKLCSNWHRLLLLVKPPYYIWKANMICARKLWYICSVVRLTSDAWIKWFVAGMCRCQTPLREIIFGVRCFAQGTILIELNCHRWVKWTFNLLPTTGLFGSHFECGECGLNFRLKALSLQVMASHHGGTKAKLSQAHLAATVGAVLQWVSWCTGILFVFARSGLASSFDHNVCPPSLPSAC